MDQVSQVNVLVKVIMLIHASKHLFNLGKANNTAISQKTFWSEWPVSQFK